MKIMETKIEAYQKGRSEAIAEIRKEIIKKFPESYFKMQVIGILEEVEAGR